MESRKLYPILTYAGMLPFIGCALMPLVGLQELWNLGSYDYIAASYGLAITSPRHTVSRLFASCVASTGALTSTNAQLHRTISLSRVTSSSSPAGFPS
jgi:hypothetical protein